jgi:hypothetical protein
LSSSTTRTSVVDSSRTSMTSGSLRAMISLAIASTSSDLLTVYGIDVTTICWRPRGSFSTLYSPRRRIAPCPPS